MGASGIVRIRALLPGSEGVELPTIFTAVILAQMWEPHGKLNGDERRREIRIEHCEFEITVESAPSHDTVSVTY